MTEDARIAAARRQRDRAARADRGDPEDAAQHGQSAGGTTELERAATGSVTTSLVQANRCQDWATHMTQDWWIRRKIQTEQLGGLGPPAIMLRIENAELDSRLDGRSSEDDVRELVADFNRRVIEARRQLLGGPPVVTPTRDIEAELSAWRERRQQRQADEREQWGAGQADRPQHRRRRVRNSRSR